jgi:hypothetical protein
VPRHEPDLDEQRRKAREADLRLARYERLTRIALLLLFVLAFVLLALVAIYLWNRERI